MFYVGVKEFLKSILGCLRDKWSWNRFFDSYGNTFGLDRRTMRRAKRLGFTADEYVIFDLGNNNPDEYISEYERFRFRDAVRDYRVIFDNKLICYSIIRNLADVNTIYACRVSGVYTVLEEGFERGNLLDRLAGLGHMVYKKIDAGGGEGFRLIACEDGRYYINRRPVPVMEVEKLLDGDNYLVEEYCRQGAFENSLWPYSVNTVRIVTLHDNGGVCVACALQRIGYDMEKCVDNAHAGGMVCVVDIETGELSKGRSYNPRLMFDEGGKRVSYGRHPVTNAQLEGARIPNWEGIVEGVKCLHEKLLFTGVDFIAWDIALLDDGYRVIEANTSCGVDILQLFNGARRGKIGQWMKAKGYIE
jgi:hypothetical protein